MTQSATGPKVVVVGAGIVGCSVADELTALGWTNVTVLEQGPLWAAGGSTSHAPGLVFQCNASKTMTTFAAQTVEALMSIDLDGEPCFLQVGSVEVASSPERVTELHRRRNWLQAWGIEAFILTPDEITALVPAVDTGAVLAGLHVPTDGLAKAVRACEAMGRKAIERGARFVERCTVTGIETETVDGVTRTTGVNTDQGAFSADHVVMCGGFWAPELADALGTHAPLQALAHQLAWTTAVSPLAGAPTEAEMPMVRWQEQDLYYRQKFDGLGVGWYGHDPKPVFARNLPTYDDAEVMPSVLPFVAEDFDEAWRRSLELVPSLAEAKVEEAIDGIFSFTTDGFPLMGPVPEVRGLWAAEAVWVTHSVGVARATAQWMVNGRPDADVHECDIRRFHPHQLAPAYVTERGAQNYVEVYDLIHPLQPMESPRPLRTTAFRERQRELGAEFLEASGWERPQWYASNASLLEAQTDSLRGLTRDDWSARFWSPIAAAESFATRNTVALHDMSALVRIDVHGRGAEALLMQHTTGRVDRGVGSVTYCLMLSPTGGILSDVTVTRLGVNHFQIGANSAIDVAMLAAAAEDRGDVVVTDITGGTVCLGLWGPKARAVLAPLTSADLSNAGLPYFRATRTYLNQVPVTLMRLSYVGELGWEIYTTADFALKLWDTLMAAGSPHGLVPAGRASFTSMRLEKGYRSYGSDMTDEHSPAEAGLSFAVRASGGFVGAEALAAREASAPTRRLVTLHLDGDDVVPMGKEPIVNGAGTAIGYVTSAAYGHTIGKPIALGWLPAEHSAEGTEVSVRWFDRELPARVVPDVSYDAAMTRLKG